MEKPVRGVLVSLTAEKEGLRLNLHDVVRNGADPSLWKKADLITFKEIEEREIVDLEFDEKELADFGYYILCRIHAFNSLGEAP